MYLFFLIFFFNKKITVDSIPLTQKEWCPKRYPNLFFEGHFFSRSLIVMFMCLLHCCVQSFLLVFLITCLFDVLCEYCVFVCSFSYVSHVYLCFVILNICMNLVCLFLQALCGCVFV